MKKFSIFNFQFSKNDGFTLLELLVSISIIGVLISLAAVSYSTAQKKSRDAKRLGDLKSIQNAMEQYYSSCGYVYPTGLPDAGDALTCGSDELIQKMPVDPKSASPYPCTCAAASYSICANDAEAISPPCVKNLQ